MFQESINEKECFLNILMYFYLFEKWTNGDIEVSSIRQFTLQMLQ